MRYVVVGAGIAGASAVKAIRRSDPKADIAVVSAETPFYYRPLIPGLVAGTVDETDLRFREDVIRDQGAELIIGEAQSIDVPNKTLTLSCKADGNWDRLCIATGGRSLRLNIPGGERVQYVRTLEDGRRIAAAAKKGRTAVVIGGGFAGIKTAEALAKRGLSVTVVEQLPHILVPRLDAPAAALVQQALVNRGIDIVCGDSVAAVETRSVRLVSGDRLPAELVVAAVGTVPDIGWVRGSNISVNRGIAVDEYLQTSVPGVYAAGDVAETQDLITGSRRPGGLWTHAAEMGRIAGTNMAGGRISYPGSLAVMNATEIAGVPMVSAGNVGSTGHEAHVHRRNGSYRKFVFAGDRITGMIMLGEIRNAGVYTAFIKSGRSLGTNKAKAAEGQLSFADFGQGFAEPATAWLQ